MRSWTSREFKQSTQRFRATCPSTEDSKPSSRRPDLGIINLRNIPFPQSGQEFLECFGPTEFRVLNNNDIINLFKMFCNCRQLCNFLAFTAKANTSTIHQNVECFAKCSFVIDSQITTVISSNVISLTSFSCRHKKTHRGHYFK